MNDTSKSIGPPPVRSLRPPPPPKREVSPLTKILPTDRLAFEKQIEVATAFAVVHETNGHNPVANDAAGGALTPTLASTTVLTTNAFFVDVGLLVRHEDAGKFTPSQELLEYQNARLWDEVGAGQKLRPLFERSWFYRCLAPKLHLAAQPKAACHAILAGESGAKKEHEERLNILLRFLQFAGIITIQGDNVAFSQQGRTSEVKPSEINRNSELPLERSPKQFDDQEEHTLYLDKDRKRCFKVSGPLFLSRSEYTRICKWIEVTLIVEELEPVNGKPQ